MQPKPKSRAQLKVESLRRRKKRTDAAIDLIKTIIIYLLTASMLATAGLYINGRQNAGQAQAPEIPREKMRVIETGGTVRAEINENHANPVQITVTTGGNSFTVLYSDNKITDVYENFKKAVLGVFGFGSVCARLDREAGDELWRECAGAPESVYIRYAGDYLYPVIYTFLDKSWDGRNAAGAFAGELAMVRELFILDKNPVFGVARDSGGNIAIFTPGAQSAVTIKNNISAEKLAAAAEDTAGVMPCRFLRGGELGAGIKNLKFPDSFHAFDNYSAFSTELKYTNPLLDENNIIDASQGFIDALFGLLNFNIESSISYPCPERGGDGIIFEDGKSAVNIYADGYIIYDGKPSGADIRSGAGGVHLSKFLAGFDGAGGYTFYEKIKAASVFVSSIAGELTGNEGRPRLQSITSDADESLRLVFAYYYEGIKIKIDGVGEGVAVEITKDRITSAKIRALSVSSQNMDMIKNRDPAWELSVIDAMLENGTGTETENFNLEYDQINKKFIVNAFEPVYKIDYINYTGGGIAKAVRELS